MNRRIVRGVFVLILAVTVGVFFTQAVHAADPTFTPNVPIPGLFPADGQTSEPVDANIAGRYIRALYVYFVGIVGVLAVVMIMYAGFLWITAAGNSSKISEAKQQLNGATVGVILALTSFLLLQLINPELVTLRIPFIQPVEKIVQASYFCSGLPAESVDYGSAVGGTCGVKYSIKNSASTASSGKALTCTGDLCDGLVSPEKGQQVCAPLKDGDQYRCQYPQDACERQKPDGVTVDEWCPFIDRLLQASQNPSVKATVCAKTNDRLGKDDCTAGEILTCDSDFVRVDCNAGATTQFPKTVCWDSSKPRTVRYNDYQATCQPLSNARPAEGADTVCCRAASPEKIQCEDSPPLFHIEVSCADVGVTTCSKKCYAPIHLRAKNSFDGNILNATLIFS